MGYLLSLLLIIPLAGFAATIAAALLGFHFIIQAAVPWIVRVQAATEGRTFFNATLVPSFDPLRLAPDLGLVLAALALDLWLGSRSRFALALWGQTPRGLTPFLFSAGSLAALGGLGYSGWLPLPGGRG